MAQRRCWTRYARSVHKIFCPTRSAAQARPSGGIFESTTRSIGKRILNLTLRTQPSRPHPGNTIQCDPTAGWHPEWRSHFDESRNDSIPQTRTPGRATARANIRRLPASSSPRIERLSARAYARFCARAQPHSDMLRRSRRTQGCGAPDTPPARPTDCDLELGRGLSGFTYPEPGQQLAFRSVCCPTSLGESRQSGHSLGHSPQDYERAELDHPPLDLLAHVGP